MKLAIYGAGGLGRELLELARQINKYKQTWSDIIFAVDEKYYDPNNDEINGAKVIPYDTLISQNSCDGLNFVIAQGEPIHRKGLKDKINNQGFELATMIHPSVDIPDSTKVGIGAIIKSWCVISCNVTIGENVLIQSSVIIGHDSVVGSNSVLSGASILAGNVNIGASTYIGINSCVKERLSIGRDTIIGMGSVVFRDIGDEVIALGNPARVMKKNIDKIVFR